MLLPNRFTVAIKGFRQRCHSTVTALRYSIAKQSLHDYKLLILLEINN